ncbi:MAG TPA: hypothetical protein PK359_17005 [Burkholderiaceae bacterium]|jgi:hypothetical protein|nr:hypothetical protein [Burkholderiaceae bacterium]
MSKTARRCQRLILAGAALLALSLLGACQALLPEMKARTQVPWETFAAARDVIERVKVNETRREQLTADGLDPYTNPAVTLLTYTDIVQRFAIGSAVRPEELDQGIRSCLSAGKRCTGYSIAARNSKRERVGNFWLDSLNFRQETDVTGWTFNALIIMVDEIVVFTVFGGQPRISEHEIIRNPLGPLQSWGERAPAFIR